MSKPWSLVVSLILSFSFSESLAKFLPENDMKIGVHDVSPFDQTMTEARFNEIISDVANIYAPIISQMGGRLVVNRLWTSSQVNAFAHRDGNLWNIDMHGGLARHHDITDDAFALVVCHEIGHHIGGSPKFTGNNLNWASVEGQADYFAALKCLRKVFARNNDNRKPGEDPIARQKCEESFGPNTDSDICVRIVMAGKSAANMFHSHGAEPSLGTKDPRVVNVTYEDHPEPQCRLDTYLEGALCGADPNEDVSQSNPNQGTCHRAVANIVGYRPLCWFKPLPSADTGDKANPPGLNGQQELRLSNPNSTIVISWDVSGFPETGGVYLEISRTNTGFSNPNGIKPDPQALGGAAIAGPRGQIRWQPNRLPGWGTYELRVIALDRSGRLPVGRFSNSSRLILKPNSR